MLQQRGVPGEQADAAAKVVLERLIHQSLAVQRALQLDLDRDPKVQLQLDLARREVLARAYLERVGAAAVAPDADAVRRYYDEHPALFAKRRIFQLQEIAIEARPEQVDALRARLGEGGDVDSLADWLRANGYRFAAVQAVRAAEQRRRRAWPRWPRCATGRRCSPPRRTGCWWRSSPARANSR